MKSDTCFGKMSGQPLSEYAEEYKALDAANYSREQFNNDLIPYQCDKCSFWHLSPKARVTPSKKCIKCTAGDGTFKDAYRTKSEAHKRANIIYDEGGINLNVYECEFGNGWHLTKRF